MHIHRHIHTYKNRQMHTDTNMSRHTHTHALDSHRRAIAFNKAARMHYKPGVVSVLNHFSGILTELLEISFVSHTEKSRRNQIICGDSENFILSPPISFSYRQHGILMVDIVVLVIFVVVVLFLRFAFSFFVIETPSKRLMPTSGLHALHDAHNAVSV